MDLASIFITLFCWFASLNSPQLVDLLQCCLYPSLDVPLHEYADCELASHMFPWSYVKFMLLSFEFNSKDNNMNFTYDHGNI
jgi:hypothetical protein